MRYLKISMACLLAVTMLFSLSATVFANASDAPPFPVNENGETYGDYFQATRAGKDPDLILAQGEDGTLGYVRSADLEEPLPESPEAALAIQSERRTSGYKGRYINLYAADGVTVIGRFFVGAGLSDSDSIYTRSEITYSAYSSMESVNYSFLGRSAIQRVLLGVKFFGIVQSDDIMQAGELAAKIQLYDYDSGSLVCSEGYTYSTTSGQTFTLSKTYHTSSGVYYCKGLARVYDREEQAWGNFGLKKADNCQID